MREPLSIKDTVRLIEERTGVRKSYATIWRWMEKGVGGKKLDFVYVGGTRHVLPDSVTSFINDRTQDRTHSGQAAVSATPPKPSPTASAIRQRQIAANTDHLRQTLGRQRGVASERSASK